MSETLPIVQAERIVERRLAAIAFLDVAGYARLVSTDEVATLQAWSQLRNTLIEPLLLAWRGRVVDRAGDSIFAEFPSALEALHWAVDAQSATTRHFHGGKLIRLRIALHLTDVIDGPDGEVQGDGVNVAARLQTYAKAGRVIMSRAFADAIRGTTNSSFVDLGFIPLKNIKRPIHAFQLRAITGHGSITPISRKVPRIITRAVGIAIALPLLFLSITALRDTPRNRAERLLQQGLAISCPGFPCPREWLEKRSLYEQAIATDPKLARPYAEAAFTYTNLVANHLSEHQSADLDTAAGLATNAIALAPKEAFGYEARGAVLRQRPDQLEYALTAYQRALSIKPDLVSARANVGWLLVLTDRPGEGEIYLRAALAATPQHSDASFWLSRLGLAEVFLGRFGNAADLFRQAIAEQPEGAVAGDTSLERAIDLAAALALEGKLGAARQVIDDVRHQYPHVSVRDIWNCVCSDAPGFQAGIAKLRQGAILAGIAEMDE
jgi:class 3 adenylate cyclase/Tfp pilus assembly protein PilF